MNLPVTLAAHPRLNNIYFWASRQARYSHARQLHASYYGARTSQLLAKDIVADPMRTRRIISNYQGTLETRIDRVRSLAGKTIKQSFESAAPKVAGSQDGSVGIINILDSSKAGAEIEAWMKQTMMAVLLDAGVEEIAPRAGHFLIGINSQTIGVAAVQAFDQAKKIGIEVSSELEEFVANVRSIEPANIAATRQFGLLRDMSFDTGAVVREELIAGLRAEKDPGEIARAIDRKLKSVNLTRARTIARTEVTGAHATATLNAYQTSGIRTVEPLVEFTLNQHGSSDPCPICVDIAGRIYTVESARSVIPVHANCQCGWVPVSRRPS